MSWQMTAAAAFVRATRKRRFLTTEGGRAMLERPKGSAEPPARLRRRFDVTTVTVGGFDVVRIRRPDSPAADGAVVVLLHGGAYVSQVVRQHWALAAAIAARVDAEVWVPIYGLAPDHHAAQALDLLAEVLDELGTTGRPCWLLGDSAGGGLALSAAQQWAGRGGSTLRGLTLVAPWLDLSMSNPEIELVEPRDPWLARPALRTVADAWAGDIPLRDPRVSPLFGDLAHLPPVDLWVGTRDITLPDTRLLRDRLAASGRVRHHEDEGAIHVHPLLPVPEGRRARDAIIAHIADGLGRPQQG